MPWRVTECRGLPPALVYDEVCSLSGTKGTAPHGFEDRVSSARPCPGKSAQDQGSRAGIRRRSLIGKNQTAPRSTREGEALTGSPPARHVDSLRLHFLHRRRERLELDHVGVGESASTSRLARSRRLV